MTSLSVSPAQPAGFRHAAAFYDSDESFVDTVLAFLDAGLAADEPALVAVDARKAELVRSALPRSRTVEFLVDGSGYRNPASTIGQYLARFRAHVAGSPVRLRVVGEVLDPSAPPVVWEPWARYEASINDLYRRYPVSGLCPYNTVTTPPAVLADVARTHPILAANGRGHGDNVAYLQPAAFLADRPTLAHDPLQSTPPVFELTNPMPAAARQAVFAAAALAQLDHDVVDDFEVAVSEIVTNALLYGRAPVTVHGWTAPQRLLITVHDTGPGPADPFAGLRPVPDRSSGGLGLWIAHQLCGQVEHHATRDGFTVRLSVQTEPPSPAQPKR